MKHNLQDPKIKQQELLKDHIVGDENGAQQWWNQNYHSKYENSSNQLQDPHSKALIYKN